ncbi:conserved Plasmodium protein, unknown function [Plasmodium gallinaceum]|uniref:Uncharacterized protein n=1 Tax=Plasmodium gallinaceum TaxID=5849 RepID=A0A1J1GL08_PLAGA|nr:conserved Plasmodium protein, unknown function [Plasmodium gallinaceum]CRG93104.1 conserved Plasmodium protein, unknown function [Plasmodium gallinaceum]
MIQYNVNNFEIPKEVFNKNISKIQSQLYSVSKFTFNNLEKSKNENYEKDKKNKILVNRIKFNKKITVPKEEKNAKYIRKNKESKISNKINKTTNLINIPENVNKKNVDRNKSNKIENTLNKYTQLCNKSNNNNCNNNNENKYNNNDNENKFLNYNDLKNNSYLIKNNSCYLNEKKIKICELDKKIYKKSDILFNLRKIDNSSKINAKQTKKLICELKDKNNSDDYMKKENKFISNDNNSFSDCSNYITYQKNINHIIDSDDEWIKKDNYANNINLDEKKKKNNEYYSIKNSDISSFNKLNEKNTRVKLKDIEKVKNNSLNLFLNSNTKKNNSNYLYMNINNKKKYSYKNINNKKYNNKININSFENKKLNEIKLFSQDKNNIEKKKIDNLELRKDVNVKGKYMKNMPKKIIFEVNKKNKENLNKDYTKKKNIVNKKLHVNNNKNVSEKKGNTKIISPNVLLSNQINLEKKEKCKNIKVNNIVKEDCINKKNDIFDHFNNKRINSDNNESNIYVKCNFNNDESRTNDKVRSKDTHIYAYSIKQEGENNSLNFDKNEKNIFDDNEYEMNLNKLCFKFKNKIIDEKNEDRNVDYKQKKIENSNIFHYNTNNIENVNKNNKNNINNFNYNNNDYIKQIHDINFINCSNNTQFINENVSSNIIGKKRSKSVNYLKDNKFFNSLIVTNELRIKMCYSNNYVDFKKLNYGNIYEEKKDENTFFPINHDSFLNSSDLFFISVDSDKTKSSTLQKKKKNSHVNLNDFNNLITDNLKQESFHNSYFGGINRSYSNSLNINEIDDKFNLINEYLIDESNLNKNMKIENSIYKNDTFVDKKNKEDDSAFFSLADKIKDEKKCNYEKLQTGECYGSIENNLKDIEEKKKFCNKKDFFASDKVLGNSNIINLNIFREVSKDKGLAAINVEKTYINDDSLLMKKKKSKNNNTTVIQTDNLNISCISSDNEYSTSKILKYDKGSLEDIKRNILSYDKKKKKKKLNCKEGKQNKKNKISNKIKEKIESDKKEFIKNTNNDRILKRKNHLSLLNTEKIKNMSIINLKKEINDTLNMKDSDSIICKPIKSSNKNSNKKKKKKKKFDKLISCKIKEGNNLLSGCKKNNNVLSLDLNDLTNEKKQKMKSIKKVKVIKDNNFINNEKKNDSIIKVTDKCSDIVSKNLKNKKKKKKKIITQKNKIKKSSNYLNLTKNYENSKNINFIMNKNDKEMVINDSLKEVNKKNKNALLTFMKNNENIKEEIQKIYNKLKRKSSIIKDGNLLMKYDNTSLVKNKDKLTKNFVKKNVYEIHNNIKFKDKNQIHQFSTLKLLISKKHKKGIIKIEKEKKITKSLKADLYNTRKGNKDKGKTSFFYKKKLEKKNFGDKVNYKNDLKICNPKFPFNNKNIKLSNFNFKNNYEIVPIKSKVSNSKGKKYSEKIKFKNNEKYTLNKNLVDMNYIKNIMGNINYENDSTDSCFYKNLKLKDKKQVNILNICYNNNLSINYIEKDKEKMCYTKSLENRNEYSNKNYKKKKLENKKKYTLNKINIKKIIKKVNKKKKKKFKKTKQKLNLTTFICDEKKEKFLFNLSKIIKPLKRNTFSKNPFEKNYEYLFFCQKENTINCDLEDSLNKKKKLVEKEQINEKKIEIKNIEFQKKSNEEINSEKQLNKNNCNVKEKNTFLKQHNLYNEKIENDFTLKDNVYLIYNMKNNFNTNVHKGKISSKNLEQKYSNLLHENNICEKKKEKKFHYLNEKKKDIHNSKENNINKTKSKNKEIITDLMKSNKCTFEKTVKSNSHISDSIKNLETLFSSNCKDIFRYKSENLNSNTNHSSFSEVKICKDDCIDKKGKYYNSSGLSNIVPNHINEIHENYNSSNDNNDYNNKDNISHKSNSNTINSFTSNNSNIFINNENIKEDIKENMLEMNPKNLISNLKDEINTTNVEKYPERFMLNLEKYVTNHRINEISLRKIILKNNTSNYLSDKKGKNNYEKNLKNFPHKNKEKTQEIVRKEIKTNIKSIFPLEKEKYLWCSNDVNIKEINHDYMNFKKKNLINNKNSQKKKEYPNEIKKVEDINNNIIFCSNFFHSNSPKQNTLNKNDTNMIRTFTIKELLSNKIKQIKKKEGILRTISMNNICRIVFPKSNLFNSNKKNNNLNKIKNKNNNKRSNSTLLINNYKSFPYKLNKTKSLIYIKNNNKHINYNSNNKNINGKFKTKENYINSKTLKLPHDEIFIYSFNLNNKKIYKKQIKENITLKKNKFYTNEKIQKNNLLKMGSNYNILKRNIVNKYNKKYNLNNHNMNFFKRKKSSTFFKTSEKISNNLNKNIDDNENILQKKYPIKNKNIDESKKIKKCFSLLSEKLNRKFSFTNINLLKNEKGNQNHFKSTPCFLFESTMKNNKNKSEDNIDIKK